MQDVAGETALIKAARIGNLHAIRLLLAKGARPELKDYSGFSPILRAAYEGHRDAVKVLQARDRERERERDTLLS